MLTPDVRFESFTPVDWTRFLSLWRGERAAVEEGAPRGGLVVIHDGGRVRKALHTVDGRVDPAKVTWPAALEDVAREHRATWAWAMHSGALEELMERWGARARRSDDALSQGLQLFTAFRELLAEGAIASWPRRLEGVPIPTRAVVDRALDAFVPPGRSALLAFYDAGELWTAIVLRRSALPGPARFDVVAGPTELRRAMGLVSGEFRRDYRHLVDAAEAIYAPPSFGFHAEVSTFRALITSAEPGDWARAVAMREVVVSPMPRVLAVPLSVDAGRGVFGAAARFARQLDPLGVVQPVLQALGHALPSLPPVAGRAAPGFDPLEVLRRLLQR
ncbi:MAG: hypothetical protein NVSMB47_12820 [Polyangiales bacterium]